ncbi:MAG: hypothetical protein QOI12_3109 [Alphaproteobacteria bacterium]|jgi:hypothetical protein|nr:hypothetical protein [Alphaproteobacteria bacterium]
MREARKTLNRIQGIAFEGAPLRAPVGFGFAMGRAPRVNYSHPFLMNSVFPFEAGNCAADWTTIGSGNKYEGTEATRAVGP